jgi:DNA-directed RNA polymerase subunit RPC12/RpoP
MPTITKRIDTKVDVEVDVEVDFSVYCGECGAGICSDSDYDERREKLTVRCPHCFDAFEKFRKELEDEIERLNEKIEQLEGEK